MIRVLVADDEEKVSQLICNLVDWPSLDMEIVGVAKNGLEALEMTEKLRPDIVITDIRMPGCDGIELIRRIKARGDGPEIAIISGHRHFDYAQSAIRFGVMDYLLKPIKKDELVSTLERMRNSYLNRSQQFSREESLRLRRQNDIGRLRSGLFSAIFSSDGRENLVSAEKINLNYHYNMRGGCFRLLHIKIDGDYDTLHTDGLAVLCKKAAAVLRDSLAEVCCDMETMTEKSRISSVLNYNSEDENVLKEHIRQALDTIKIKNNMYPDVVFTIALGQAVQDPRQLPDSACSANRVLANRIMDGAGGIIEKDPGPSVLKDMEMVVSRHTLKFGAAIEIMNEQDAADSVTELMDSCARLPGVTGEDIVRCASIFCGDIMVIMRNMQLGIPDSHLVYGEFMERLDLCSSAAEVTRCLLNTVFAAFTDINSRRNLEQARPIMLAKQFIANNYMQQITLEQISKEVGFNSSYFSALFKKETGQNFLEYLAEVRMDAAKEMLREKDIPISEICFAVGYQDPKYFGKSFKKVSGLKPSEFRKLYS